MGTISGNFAVNHAKQEVSFKSDGTNSTNDASPYESLSKRHNNLSSKSERPANSEYGKEHKKDILIESPIRMLGYTNEVGEALRPAVGSMVANLFWVPALMYFGADIWDKYKRGQDDSYQNSDKKTALRQAVFHTVASLVGPTAAIHIAQHGAMKAGGDKWVDKTLKKINTANSSLASKIEKVPFIGKKLIKVLKKPTAGKKLLANSLKTGVGFATLAAVAIPLDMLTERLLIKKVVNPALGLRDNDYNPYGNESLKH